MEISEIITKAFLYKNPSIYKELDVIISELGRFSIDEILEQKNQEISIIDRDIRNSVNDALYYQESKEENIKKVANLIYTVRLCLEKGILNADVKSILIFLSINCYLQINIDKFIENGLNPNVLCESPNVDMLLALVNEGLGATIVPQSTLIEPHHENVSILEISDAKIISKSAIIWLKDRYLSKSAEQFIELFK